MDEQRNDFVKGIFQEALDRPDAERTAFVESACAGNDHARERVMALLDAYAGADSFLPSRPGAARDPGDPVRGLAPTGAAGGAAAVHAYVGTTIGPYKLLQLIGEGGFGAVYMAEQEKPIRRRVALKLIKLGMDTKQVIARFEAERQALAMMEHPNIARVFDAGATDEGRPYFVMELVKGVPITEFCDANCLSTRERLQLFVQVCSAVQHAHQKGVIHRDLKPSNVLVTMHDDRPVPKVIDFGVARAADHRLTDLTLFTEFGQFIGTPVYMSPEQADMSGLDIDTRSDIYSLGVLLYELLTSTTPYTGGQLRQMAQVEILRVLSEVEPPRPSTRVSQLGERSTMVAQLRRSEPGALERLLRGDLDWIVMKALEKDRTRRYASASELSADIDRFFGGDPVSAGPPGAGYRMRKFVRRNRGKAAAAAAVLAALVLGGATALWQGVEAKRQAERARASSIVASAAAAQDPVLKALLIDEIADVPGVRGRLTVLRDIANQPLPVRVVQADERHNNLTYSDDGRNLAASLVDGTVRVWRSDGTEAPVILRADAGAANSVGFSPDASRLVAGYDDGAARVWRTDGSSAPVVLDGHGGPVYGTHFSAAGDRVITLSGDAIRVWPVDGGNPVVLRADGVELSHPEIDAEGRRVLAGGSDGAVRIWPADGSASPLVLRGHTEPVWAEFSHDGTRVVTGSSDGAVRVWPADGFGEPRILPHPGWVYWQVNFTADDGTLVTGSTDGTVRVWDLHGAGEPVVLPHGVSVIDSKPTGDGTRILTAAVDGKLRVWGPDGRGVPVVFAGPPGPVGLRRAPDDAHLVGAFADGTLRTWRLDATGEASVLRHEAAVRDARFSPDGRRIVTASIDGLVRVWHADVSSAPTVLRGHTDAVFVAAFDAEGDRLVTASADGTARIWRVDGAGEPLVLRHPDVVYAAAFSRDGRRIVTGSRDGAVRAWDADARGAPEILYAHAAPVHDVAFAPDGSRLISASADGTARITPLEAGGDPVVLRGLNDVYTAAFSPDGERVVTGSGSGDLRIWRADGSDPPVFLEGHQDAIGSAVFSADGMRLLTSSLDGTARIWHINGRDEPIVLRGHEDRIRRAAFSPDGQRVVTASYDGTARVWRVGDAALLDYLRENVRACLAAEQRIRFLGESATEAESIAEACQLRLAEDAG